MKWDGMPKAMEPMKVPLHPEPPSTPRPTCYHFIALRANGERPFSGTTLDFTLLRDDLDAMMRGDGIVAEYQAAYILDANGAVVWSAVRA